MGLSCWCILVLQDAYCACWSGQNERVVQLYGLWKSFEQLLSHLL